MQGRLGQASRRGPLREGDRVQITDPKGRKHTVVLVAGATFQSARGSLRFDDVIGRPDGQVVTTPEGRQFQVIRPLLADYVMSMPRGPAIVYPKDAGAIVARGDIFPGAFVVEAGAGSGALTLSLLQAVGAGGRLLSVERRAEFAAIARDNVDLWFGAHHPAWELRVGELADALAGLDAGCVERVVLDMLAPWREVGAVARALAPGGVLTCYVTTASQLSRVVDAVRAASCFAHPLAWELVERGWHVEGLAVRPEHRMVGHTGFLVTWRRLAPGVAPPRRARRAAKASDGQPGTWDAVGDWEAETPGPNARKLRRVRRDLGARAERWVRERTAAQDSATRGERPASTP